MQQVRHTTVSTFFFARFGALWRMCTVEHPRHGGYLAPGGHVRDDEPPVDAALREAAEESGFRPRLLPAPLPSGYPHPGVVGPWWTVDMVAGPDGRTDVRHLHRDHVFVGVVALPYEPVGTPELLVRWVGREEFQALDAPADTKVLGAHLFDVIASAVRPQAATAPDDDLTAELLRRQELDQEVRLLRREDRTPEALERWKRIDLDNRLWLEQLVEEREDGRASPRSGSAPRPRCGSSPSTATPPPTSSGTAAICSRTRSWPTRPIHGMGRCWKTGSVSPRGDRRSSARSWSRMKRAVCRRRRSGTASGSSSAGERSVWNRCGTTYGPAGRRSQAEAFRRGPGGVSPPDLAGRGCRTCR